jgi:hypothetical protein
LTNKKICVFTAHSPSAGGGSVILRSLIKYLPEFSFSWFYIGNDAIPGYENGYLGKSLMGGNAIDDIWNTYRMLGNYKVNQIDKLANQLSKIDCDVYWIISHNEGLRIALELSNKQSRPVHMTVHDDWAGALCARSIRYRFMSVMAKKLTIATLKAVASFDLISIGMQSYYQAITGLKGDICHRYLPESALQVNNQLEVNEQEIIVGHIGSIYDKDVFLNFVSVFNEFAISKSKKPVIKIWGCHLTIKDIPAKLKDSVQFYDNLPEEQVVRQLSACDFVYAMYPLKNGLKVFSKTSLPTKLTSYLQAGRPIFGHGPIDSSLAEFLKRNDLGVMWTSQCQEDGFNLLERISSTNINDIQLENARRQYFGEGNVIVMRKALSNSKLIE